MPLTDDDNEFIDTLVNRLKDVWQTPSTTKPENPDAGDPETVTEPTPTAAEQGGELTTPAAETQTPESTTVEVETPQVVEKIRTGLRGRFGSKKQTG